MQPKRSGSRSERALSNEHTREPNAEGAAESTVEDAPAKKSRRDLLRKGGKKAMYLTPVVLTLAASHAHAGSSDAWLSWCASEGSPCVDHADCCPGLSCMGGTCDD
jgi:hypothetical protein